MTTCGCGGQILTVYIRRRKPGGKQGWLVLGRACIQCRRWEGKTAHQVDTNADEHHSPVQTTEHGGAEDLIKRSDNVHLHPSGLGTDLAQDALRNISTPAEWTD